MSTYLNNRVLKINVGFLLHDGPAHSQDSELDFPAVRVSDDLTLTYVRGPIRLSRTHEGILVQADLRVGISSECYRCLEETIHEAELHIEELFTHQAKFASEFHIGDDAILDLNPLLRDEALIDLAHGVLCRPDCKGLCPDCGANLNWESCTCSDKRINPQFARLKELLDPNS